jgi:hypothetical protein
MVDRNNDLEHSGQSSIGLGLIVLGLPVYWYWESQNRKGTSISE